uniref:Uncharacterized protein n=1 Tax=Anguilla anguilla TaxID=7936 RepID=A0A0E9WHP5_ANGAN
MTYRLHVQLFTGYNIAKPYGFNRSSSALTRLCSLKPRTGLLIIFHALHMSWCCPNKVADW